MIPPLRVLAVADSDSYLKWACATLAGLGHGRALLLRTPILPTPGQVRAATHGTGVDEPDVVTLLGLRRRLRSERPDVLLIAATGPTAEVVARLALALPQRPVLVSGLPGMALPAQPDGVGYRRWTDVFVVHSPAERAAYAAAFAEQGVSPVLELTRLPFLEQTPAADSCPPVRRVVLAAQAKVPAGRAERLALLDGLAATARDGYDVVVKVRARPGERQTHDEAHPYDVLWSAEHARLGHPLDALRFEDGPLSAWLDPTSVLVTVSSTAVLEAMARAVPAAVLADLGFRDDLLNAPFQDCGCVTTLAALRGALPGPLPRPDPVWTGESYLHDAPATLPGTLRRLVADRAAGEPARGSAFVPWSTSRHRQALVRATVPAWPLDHLVVPAARTARSLVRAMRPASRALG